ncbi:MAG: class II aldolase/adducin family protein [Mycobacterium sp.]
MSDSAALKAEVALASRILAKHGSSDLIWGHASARDPEGRGVWIKQSGWGLEEVTAERVHLVSREGAVVSGDGPRHGEYPIHTEMMAARPDVGGVVHTHSRYAVALGANRQPLRPVSHEANYFVPPAVPEFTQTADLILTPELGRALAATLGGAPAAFIVNHGIVAVGPTIQIAAIAAILLERASRQQLLTQQYGGQMSWSDEAESLSKRGHIYTPEAMIQVWDYLVRDLDKN